MNITKLEENILNLIELYPELKKPINLFIEVLLKNKNINLLLNNEQSRFLVKIAPILYLDERFNNTDIDENIKNELILNPTKFWTQYNHKLNPLSMIEYANCGNLNMLKHDNVFIHDKNIINWSIRYASRKGHLNIVEYLVNNHSKDIIDNNNFAFMWACYHGHLNIVKFLVEKGANISSYNNYAIRYASGNGHFNVVQYLVSKGVVFDKIDNDKIDYLPYIEYLVDQNYNFEQLNRNIKHINIYYSMSCLSQYVTEYIDIYPDNNHNYLYYYIKTFATYLLDLNEVKINENNIIKFNGRVNLKINDLISLRLKNIYQYDSPICEAIKNNHLNIVIYLTMKGNTILNNDSDLLKLAIKHGNTDIVNYLQYEL